MGVKKFFFVTLKTFYFSFQTYPAFWIINWTFRFYILSFNFVVTSHLKQFPPHKSSKFIQKMKFETKFVFFPGFLRSQWTIYIQGRKFDWKFIWSFSTFFCREKCVRYLGIPTNTFFKRIEFLYETLS
jgi:hypothetical protein